MTWIELDPALTLTNEPETEFGGFTGASTSTIQVGVLGARKLRMFGVQASLIAADFMMQLERAPEWTPNPEDAKSSTPNPAPYGTRLMTLTERMWGQSCVSRLQYMDLDPTLAPTLDASGANPCFETAVPYWKVGRGWKFDQLSLSSAGGYTILLIDYLEDDFFVMYKDVSVCEVPAAYGGGLLMLAGRYRIRASDLGITDLDNADWGTALGTYGRRAGEVSPENSIGDIVAFWSSPRHAGWQTFSGDGVRGPFLMVNSRAGLFDDSTGHMAPFRCFLGVPGAAFYGDRLYVYYVVHPNGFTEDPSAPLAPYLDQAGDYLDTQVAAYDGGAGVGRELAVTAFEGVDIFDRITRGLLPTTDEAGWTGTGTDVPSASDLTGRLVRVWAPSGGAGGLTTFADACQQASARYGGAGAAAQPPMLAAPEPEVCGEHLNLYFVAQSLNQVEMDAEGQTMHGLWVSAALDPKVLIAAGTGLVVSTLGRDFVVSAPTVGTISADNFAPARYDATVPIRQTYVDPDPVQLQLVAGRPASALTRVMAQQTRLVAGSSDTTEQMVVSFEAPRSVACKSWSGAGWFAQAPDGAHQPLKFVNELARRQKPQAPLGARNVRRAQG